MKTILGIGEVVWDMMPDGKHLGGAPLNFTFYANALGAKGIPVTAIGNDALGDETLDRFKEMKLDLSCIQRNNLPTSRVNVTLDGKGIPQYEIVEGVAWDSIVCDAAALDKVSAADAVCWGILAQRTLRSRKAILDIIDHTPGGCMKVFDINIRQHYYDKETVAESLKRCNILKLNEDELPLLVQLFNLPGDEADAVQTACREFGIDEIIYTKGAECSKVYTAAGLASQIPTPAVKVADTVGAGDSFTATYVTCRLNGLDIRQAHERAVKVSAYVCTCHGAIVNDINKLTQMI